jgi:hypothetical protein
MQFAQCACEFGARTGVPLDQFIRKQHRIHSICGRDGRGSQEAGLVAAVNRAVSDLLRSDDHADCGAGPNHRVAAHPDPRPLPRQYRIVLHKGKDPAGTGSVAVGQDPGPGDRDSVNPDSLDPGPVNPGSKHSHPVFPGRTAPCAEPSSQTETAVPDAFQTSLRSGGRCPDPDYDMKIAT